MNILALDIATACGWATLSNGTLRSGTERFRWHSDREGEGYRFLRYESWINDIIHSREIGEVYFELITFPHMSTQAAHVHYGFLTLTKMACAKRFPELPCVPVPVADIKRVATGKGRIGKGAMVTMAQQEWPEQLVEDDNQADALWLLRSAEMIRNGELKPRKRNWKRGAKKAPKKMQEELKI